MSIGSRVRTSRIGLRVLAFNLLVLFLPVAGILYLDAYEDHLLEAQERGMVEQARLVAAALSGRDVVAPEDAAAFLAGLGFEGDVRIRVYGRDGALLADSRRVLRQSGSESQPYGSSGAGEWPPASLVSPWRVARRDQGSARRGRPATVGSWPQRGS